MPSESPCMAVSPLVQTSIKYLRMIIMWTYWCFLWLYYMSSNNASNFFFSLCWVYGCSFVYTCCFCAPVTHKYEGWDEGLPGNFLFLCCSLSMYVLSWPAGLCLWCLVWVVNPEICWLRSRTGKTSLPDLLENKTWQGCMAISLKIKIWYDLFEEKKRSGARPTFWGSHDLSTSIEFGKGTYHYDCGRHIFLCCSPELCPKRSLPSVCLVWSW